MPISPSFVGPRFGGISGLDYDAANDQWLAVSDDRGEHGVPRFYTLGIDYDSSGLRKVAVTGWSQLELPTGQAPDVETLRIDPLEDGLWYASEGDARAGQLPFIASVRRDGGGAQVRPLPPGFAYDPAGRSGVRPNEAIEGLAFSGDRPTFWTALEGAMLQDGPTAAPGQDAWIRLTEQRRTGEVVRQLAYPLDAVPAALAGGRLPNNGVSEILWVAPERLLVLERAGAGDATGRWGFSIRLYLVDLASGENIPLDAALSGASVQGVRKTLLFDFAKTGRYVDNIEGLAFGRRLPNGHDTLVLVSDDNFISTQETQLWVLELPPKLLLGHVPSTQPGPKP